MKTIELTDNEKITAQTALEHSIAIVENIIAGTSPNRLDIIQDLEGAKIKLKIIEMKITARTQTNKIGLSKDELKELKSSVTSMVNWYGTNNYFENILIKVRQALSK